ncbi:hypothetical protein CKO28_21895 [Rhodovibrio sodomensis]|uniref:Uncharacterized protein n=1 Tax=Rhodovibrio sodomensis TaxID=1088 RepID=A0ABS1DKY9_9PROT|nr:hypothetical protein [Rhodovibrio sodomensis]MBK1670676.1 hypothetical protein [Rhodovibrio sodomensis]
MHARLLIRIEDRVVRSYDAFVDVTQMPECAPAVTDIVVDAGEMTVSGGDVAGHLFDSHCREVIRGINAESGLPAGVELHLSAGAVLGMRAVPDAGGVMRVRAVRVPDYPDGAEIELDSTPLRDLFDGRQLDALVRHWEAIR